MTTTVAASGFEAQFQQFIYYAGPVLQIALWLVVIFCSIYAVLLFKRLVDFQTGKVQATESAVETKGEGDTGSETKKAKKDEAIKVEEFVE